VGLAGGGEAVLDADVELMVGADREPDPAAGSERLGLGDLAQAQQLAVEAARLRLAPGRGGDLHVIDGQNDDRGIVPQP
jgi:hypothetical protein